MGGLCGLLAQQEALLGALTTQKTPLIVVNPGHNRWSFKEGLGTSARGIGYEYVLVTQLANKVAEELKSMGARTVVTRDEKDYLPEINAYVRENKAALKREFLEALLHPNGRRTVTNREGVLQLGLMRYAEHLRADAMINLHLDDVPHGATAKGFTVILGHPHTSESRQLGKSLHESLSAKFTPSNLATYDKEDCELKKGFKEMRIFILGNGRVKMKVPSCLVECGFIRQNYTVDGKTHNIASPVVQELYANAIAKGAIAYF